MTSWRTLAFGEAISYDPASDIRLRSGDMGEWIVSDTGDHAFVVLPFQDQTLYTDLGDPSTQYVGLLLLTANNDHSGNFTTTPVGSWLPSEITARFGDGNGGILTDYRRDWLSAASGFVARGLTVESDGVGVVFPINKAPFLVRDLTAVPDPPPPPPAPVDPAPVDPAPVEPAIVEPAAPAAPSVPLTWRTLALGEAFDYEPGVDLTLAVVPEFGTFGPGTENVFVALPLLDGHNYTDLGTSGTIGYVGLLEITATDGSVLPDTTIGQFLLSQLQTGPGTLMDFTQYNTAAATLAAAGVTVVQRAVGMQWGPITNPGPYTIEDLDAAPDIKFIPPGFDTAGVLAGLHIAMGFGTPTRTEDRATFYLPKASTDAPAPHDLHNVPFSSTVRRAVSTTRKQVACAVEFYANGQVVEQFGVVTADKILITLLDEEYQQVKDFLYVVAGGDKYLRSITQPPMALGAIDVWQVWANSENER